jgi:hypothetical protein
MNIVDEKNRRQEFGVRGRVGELHPPVKRRPSGSGGSNPSAPTNLNKHMKKYFPKDYCDRLMADLITKLEAAPLQRCPITFQPYKDIDGYKYTLEELEDFLDNRKLT